MARLTRMEKYAGLRDALSNDREITFQGNDLNKLEDRLKAITNDDVLNSSYQSPYDQNKKNNASKNSVPSFFDFLSGIDNEPEVVEPVKEKTSLTVDDIIPLINKNEVSKNEPTPIYENPASKYQPEISNVNISNNEVENILDDLVNNRTAPVSDSLNETLKEIQHSVETVRLNIPIQEYTYDQFENNNGYSYIDEINKEYEDIKQEIEEEEEEVTVVEPIAEPIVVDIPLEEETPIEEDIVSSIMRIYDEIHGIEKPVEVKPVEVKTEEETTEVENNIEETPIEEEVEIEETYVEPTYEEPIEEEPLKVEPIREEVVDDIRTKIDFSMPVNPINEDINNDGISNEFIREALREVERYNKENERKTLSDISKTVIDNIRHPEAHQSEEDEEFSNTISLEIDKVLSEIKNVVPKVEPEIKIEPKPIETKVEKIKPIIISEDYAEKLIEATMQQPILTKTEIEEEPVEIKSLEETLKAEVLNDTIPFVIKRDEEEDEDDEFDDDSTPNKVLNVILVVLIVILVAILGVIVYYILYMKGIIG